MPRTGRPVGLQLETLQAIALVTAFEAAGLDRRRHRLLRLANALGSDGGGALQLAGVPGLTIDPGPRAVDLDNRLEELGAKLGDAFWHRRHVAWPEAAEREMVFIASSARVLRAMMHSADNLVWSHRLLIGLGWRPTSVTKVVRFARLLTRLSGPVT